MLTLEHQHAKLVNLNCRSEKHGDELVGAADLHFSFEAPNTVLDVFDPALRESLFRKAGDGEQIELLDQAADYLPKLRFPRMGAIKWDDAIAGGTLVCHHGIGGRSDITLELTKADGFRFEPKDGGTVTVSFRAACRPDEKQVGRLFGLIQSEVEISLEPAKAADDPDFREVGEASGADA